MQKSDQQSNEVLDTSEIRDPTELKRIAHKIAWARMNSSLDAGNPFVEVGPARHAPENPMHR
jgi:hypothetical protein